MIFAKSLLRDMEPGYEFYGNENDGESDWSEFILRMSGYCSSFYLLEMGIVLFI